ncbi:uncharacterized protein K02A2.6-like [Haliotis rufescens]|uniref:uncharacterized protein K02A2.6-like n=1 Tax=Haliotis rufescens TaxID=6454 RepID=UPI00201F7CED|nr:uncharacterized protein K02A2.6-like [Haliotis rufescens]
MYQEVKDHIKQMLDAKVIRPSASPYASPVVLVCKHDSSLRFCIDYRKLNSRTIRDSYALPRIEGTLDALHGAKYFSCLDLKSGYWQVVVDEEHKARTAFTVGPLGFYECNSMPFGLTNAPATFQRLMERCTCDIHLLQCLIYLDDIIVFSKTFDEHLERLQAIFQRLHKNGLKLKPSKCQFLQTSVKYLGHVISEEGIQTDPEKIEVARESMDIQSVSALCNGQLISSCAMETLSLNQEVMNCMLAVDGMEPSDDVASQRMRTYQQADSSICSILDLISNDTRPTKEAPKSMDWDTASFLRQWDSLTVKDGLLHRQQLSDGVVPYYQLIVPQSKRDEVITHLHDSMGHLGRDRTVALLQTRFYWPGMITDVEKRIRCCQRCILRKAPNQTERAPLVSIQTTQPMELVCMDYLSLEPSSGGYENILVIKDHFTKYAVAIPTRNQTARTTAKVLFDHFIVHYGIPEKLHSDQGRNFESDIIKQLCSILGILKTWTTPYHPMGNGLCERFNRTLLGMLGTLEEQQKAKWPIFHHQLIRSLLLM